MLASRRLAVLKEHFVDRWLGAALDYIPRWLEFQMRQTELPGCVIAVAHRGRIVLEQAFGYADLGRGVALTPRHRFRVASHSKSFTSAGIMRLREQGKLRLDDTAGRFVRDLHPKVACTTVAQLLSHSAGLCATVGMPGNGRTGLRADPSRSCGPISSRRRSSRGIRGSSTPTTATASPAW